MPRSRLDDDEEENDGGNYFTDQKTNIDFIRTGATVLDCLLGGGWPLGRIVNIIGDESTGKSLLCIEAASNFLHQFPKGKVFYRESEAAFDEEYAEALGMPIDKVDFIAPDDFETIEDWNADLEKCIAQCKRLGVPGLYIVDSVDALSDEAEQKRKFNEGTYGGDKPKQIGKLFRKQVAAIRAADICLIAVSQTRDKINSMFPQKTRSGGKALNFYASQIIWLSHVKDVSRTRDGIKRVVGLRIKAKCSKNKVALQDRIVEFVIRFGQGLDTVTTSLDFLEDIGRVNEAIGCSREVFTKRIAAADDFEYKKDLRRLAEGTSRIWRETEKRFLPDRRRPKYYD